MGTKDKERTFLKERHNMREREREHLTSEKAFPCAYHNNSFQTFLVYESI